MTSIPPAKRKMYEKVDLEHHRKYAFQSLNFELIPIIARGFSREKMCQIDLFDPKLKKCR